MSENNKVRLYSYNKVWKVKKKIYALHNIVLPAPVDPYDLLYFVGAIIFMVILGNNIPFIKAVPEVIRFVAMPYAIMTFLTKKKLDGKNPIKYFIGYIQYIIVERNTYIEKFKIYPNRNEIWLKVNWLCSRGYINDGFFGSSLIASKAKPIIEKPKKEKPKKGNNLRQTSKPEKVRGRQKKVKKLRIRTGPNGVVKNFPVIKENVSINKKHAMKFWKNISKICQDPATIELIRKVLNNVIFRMTTVLRRLRSFLKKSSSSMSEKTNKVPKSQGKMRTKPSKVKEKKTKRVPILDNITLLISVCALESGVGCSHVAKSLAYFIKNEIHETVCIVNIRAGAAIYKANGIEVFNTANFHEFYDKYKYVILDIGKYDTSSYSAVKHAQIKIMCALLEDNYLQMLAKFIRSDKDTKKWKYIFNHVPDNKHRQVADKMEDYEHWCMPVNDAMSFDKRTMATFDRLVKGERI